MNTPRVNLGVNPLCEAADFSVRFNRERELHTYIHACIYTYIHACIYIYIYS